MNWLRRNVSNVYLIGVIAAEVLGLQQLHFKFTAQRFASDILPFFEPNDAVTRTAAVLASAATLLLSGVILTAPILSLSLHQSYDTLFEVRKYLQPYRAQAEVDDVLADIESRFKQQLVLYGWLNPLYLGTWLSSIVVLSTAIFAMFYDWSARIMFRGSLSFLLASGILIMLFSVISIIFFALTRPGISKLILFVKALELDHVISGGPKPLLEPAVANGVTEPRLSTGLSLSAKSRFTWLLALVPVLTLYGYLFYNRALGDVTLAYNSSAIASSPVFVATNSDLFARKGVIVHDSGYVTGRDALKALISGKADIATAADVPVVEEALRHPDLRIILIICESHIRIVERKGATGTAKSLRGARVGVPTGTSAEYLLMRVLAEQKLMPKSIHIQSLDPRSAVMALQQRTVDAVAAWEPYAQEAIDLLGGTNNVWIYDEPLLYVEHFNLVTTTGVLSNPKKREGIIKLVSAIREASVAIYDRPADRTAVMARALGIQPSTLDEMLRNFIFPASVHPDALIPTLNAIASFSKPGVGFNFSQLINPEIYQSAISRQNAID